MSKPLYHTGCKLQISLAAPAANGPFAIPITAGECFTRELAKATTLVGAFQMCKACCFRQQEPATTGLAETAAPVPPTPKKVTVIGTDGREISTAPEPPAVEPPAEPPAPLAPPLTPFEAAASATATPGYIPQRVHVGPLEPMITPEEIRRQPVPPTGVAVAPAEGLSQEQIDAALGTDPQAGPLADPPKRPRVDLLLTAALGNHVQGGSPLGWSKLKDARLCQRLFYWRHIMGLEPDREAEEAEHTSNGKPPRVNALALGTLVHACIENFYRTGVPAELWRPTEAVKATHPELALEARRLVNFYLRRFNAEEARNWNLLAVERESRYYFPPRKVAGKRRSLCVTCRHDGIYREIKPGVGRLPPNTPSPEGAFIHELKTTAYLTGSRLRGFRHDAQLVLNALCFQHGHAVTMYDGEPTVVEASSADLFGRLQGVTVTFIGKNKTQDLNKDIDRFTYEIPEDRMLGLRDDLAEWLYGDLFERMFSPRKDQPATWPKSWLCKDILFPSYTCPYLSLCEVPETDWSYLYRQGTQLDLEALLLPKKLAKTTAKGKQAAAAVEGK